MPLKADPQGDSLYWLEAEFNGWWRRCESSRADLRQLAHEVCKYYGIEEPAVVFSRVEAKHDADYDTGVVTLYTRNRGNNPGVLIHELAHHVCDSVYEGTEHHGPEFMAIYMHLLDKWCFIPHEEFRRLAKKYKLRIGRRYRPRAFK